MDFLERLTRPLRSGVVTSGYPDEPPLLAPATRGLPEVDPDRCELDEACVRVCPTGAIGVVRTDGPGVEQATWVVDAGLCVFCGDCLRACPPGAIRLGPMVELAARSRGELVSVTQLRPKKGEAS